jgi:hypothetical protein
MPQGEERIDDSEAARRYRGGILWGRRKNIRKTYRLKC